MKNLNREIDQDAKSRALDTTFSHSYECEWLAEVSEFSMPHYYFPGGTTRGGADGLLLKVRPEHGSAWLGTFAFGRISPKGVCIQLQIPNAFLL